MARVPPARPLSCWQRLRQRFRSPVTWLALLGFLIIVGTLARNLEVATMSQADARPWHIIGAAVLSSAILIGILAFTRFLWRVMPRWWVAILPSLVCLAMWIAVCGGLLATTLGPAYLKWSLALSNASFAATFILLLAAIPVGLVATALDPNPFD